MGVCTYAALLLHDGDLEISEQKLSQVIKASGNTVEGYWPGLFAKALKGQDIAKLLSNVGSGAPAAAGAAPADAGAAAGGDDKKKEDDKKEEKRTRTSTWVACSETTTTTENVPTESALVTLKSSIRLHQALKEVDSQR